MSLFVATTSANVVSLVGVINAAVTINTSIVIKTSVSPVMVFVESIAVVRRVVIEIATIEIILHTFSLFLLKSLFNILDPIF